MLIHEFFLTSYELHMHAEICTVELYKTISSIYDAIFTSNINMI